ncbi:MULTISPECIES: DUF2934 domain-containing protein [Pseudomonas]|uniref:DUF2934 domain-containing protein n=1 Tax=Pseudomonas azadiae TaxID=2843612 RepID=A0ABS6P5F8_9PSED|nr:MULTISPECIES: DUF2934 domain-containing protein [Pseudomonas]MBV4455706.1 DUF2934 domain-containing protein [Pseudomonas azadiae]NMF43855.1 DUF2934 domain-containing protein [Pseudomonas sp. SWRI 103]
MDEETIRLTAYRIWEQQGKPDGQDFVHWLQARDELGPVQTDGLSGSIESSVMPPIPDRSKRPSTRSATAQKPRSKKLKA